MKIFKEAIVIVVISILMIFIVAPITSYQLLLNIISLVGKLL